MQSTGHEKLTFGMLIAEGLQPHIAQSDDSSVSAVREHVTLVRVEFGTGDDLGEFGELVSTRRFQIYDVFKIVVK
jgi:hypothetical protein